MKIGLWNEMSALERRLDDLAREFLGPRAILSFPPAPTILRGPFVPRADVFSENGNVVIDLELPGIDPDKDVDVYVEDEDLVVRGERKQRLEVKKEDLYRIESTYGSFERRFSLVEGVSEKDVQAEYRDGILRIILPAPRKVAQKKTVPIRASAAK